MATVQGPGCGDLSGHAGFSSTRPVQPGGPDAPGRRFHSLHIAEGHIRRSSKVFARHIDIALGSAAELSTQLEIARDVGYLDESVHRTLQDELEEIVKMLFGLLSTVTRNTHRTR